MNDSRFEPADEELLDQLVRASRDDLPDDARMRHLGRRIAPILDASASPVQWWQSRNLTLIAGAAVVAVGAFVGVHQAADAPPPRDRSAVSEPAERTSALSSATSLVDVPPVVSVDSLPSAVPTEVTATSDTASRRLSERPSVGSAVARTSAQSSGDELALLEEARVALATDPARTLALADAHAKRFARPTFAQERERLAIDALVRQGRIADAEQRAAQFEAKYPDSAHLARVRALVTPRVAPSTEAAQ